jgi:hypothetical protein
VDEKVGFVVFKTVLRNGRCQFRMLWRHRAVELSARIVALVGIVAGMQSVGAMSDLVEREPRSGTERKADVLGSGIPRLRVGMTFAQVRRALVSYRCLGGGGSFCRYHLTFVQAETKAAVNCEFTVNEQIEPRLTRWSLGKHLAGYSF